MAKRITVRAILWNHDEKEDVLLLESALSDENIRVPPLVITSEPLTPIQAYGLMQQQIGNDGLSVLKSIIEVEEEVRKNREAYNASLDAPLVPAESSKFTAVIVEYTGLDGKEYDVHVQNMDGILEFGPRTTRLRAAGVLDQDAAIAVGNFFLHGDQSREDYPLIPPNEVSQIINRATPEQNDELRDQIERAGGEWFRRRREQWGERGGYNE